MTDIDLDALVRAVREIAAEKPNHVYKKQPDTGHCLYVQEGGVPGCIVGQAATRIGVPVDALERWNDIGQIGIVLYRISRSDDRLSWLIHVQGSQDEGARWAEAVGIAEALYPGVAR
jgi:hypothetical protein